MKTSLSLLVPAGLLVALFAPSSCAAQVSLGFTLDTPTITAGTSPSDQVFTFNGTLTNNSTTPLYLNGDFFSVDPPLSGDDSSFFSTFVFPSDANGNALPQTPLAVGQSLDIALFNVTVPTGTAVGTYNGSFQIQGGATDSDYGLVAPSQSFTVTTTSAPAAPPPPVGPMPVPEVSSSMTFTVGILLMAGLITIARRRKAHPAC